MIDRADVEKAADSGVRKLSLLQSDPGRYLTRSVLAGMYLSIVVFTYWSLVHNLHDVSMGKVIASAFFGVGLTIIVFTNAELFTSNNMYLAVSSVEHQTTWSASIVLWVACYLGNLLGALIVAGMLFGANVLTELPADHALNLGALHKAHQGALAIFCKGVLANWIVCLAVRLALRCKDDIAKIAVLIMVVFIFLYLGFEHSIANMGTFAMSMMGTGTLSMEEAMYNLIWSTLGNIVGGVLFVGIPFAYINPTDDGSES